MRISDWSSDVCSSDLIADDARTDAANVETAHLRFAEDEAVGQADLVARRRRARAERIDIAALGRDVEGEAADRKSVVKGKSVSGRVDFGGRRLITQTTLSNILKEAPAHNDKDK